MSRDFPTDGEIEAYDRGFANGREYWQPIEKDRLLTELRHIATRLMFAGESSYHLFQAIKELREDK